MPIVQLLGFPPRSIFRIKWIMPRISAFYGIVVWMYWKDHNPKSIEGLK
jgi:hypothetical protein